ncbi:MAG: GTP-binding signal recognition particle [Chlorobi bacterium OLB5]|nr:MAG: GTP-binding signal recognition particle [Chlorobi bacterium OLB5]
MINNAQKSNKIFLPLTSREEEIGKIIVNCAYKVHKELGPGLLEKIYEVCFCHELRKAGLKFKRQIDIPVIYDNLIFDDCLRLDVLVEDLVICELKAIDQVNPIWKSQVLSHLKLTNKRLGYLINFHTETIKDGIKRFVI